MPVRTLELGNARIAGGPTPVFTVPAGRTAILKDIRWGKGATGAVVATLTVQRGAVANLLAIQSFSNLGPQAAGVSCFIALEPGDIVRLATDGLTVDVWCSGALLDGVA